MTDFAALINEYITSLNKEFHTGRATEHSYRPYLKTLLEAFAPDLLVTNEPTRIACGAPDYILATKHDIPVGYVEAKDIGKRLDDKSYKEQFNRYKAEPNFIITDYMEFRLYRIGELAASISIADLKSGKTKASIEPHPLNFDAFICIMKEFCSHHSVTIKSAEQLAKLMAGKAKLLAETIERSLNLDEEAKADSTLKDQMKAFQEILIHDIKPKEFGDIYGQTIAYGMFAARLHDPTLETFTREEAATLIPKSNPFLRKLFQYIAGYDLDDRIVWIVDALAEIFRSTDVASLLKDFGKATAQNDPMIHFYETFLAEYDPALRKSRGVWYTPEPVVNFIVRAVDDILKTEFGLSAGLADTSKVKIKRVAQGTATNKGKGKDLIEEVDVHKVQVLDPAAGTGTFLAEVIKLIYKRFEGQQGVWSNYVEEHLIPRINGFEILMASYAMAHLKLDMLLRETGYNPQHSKNKEQRFNIFLTNALEEHHPDTGSLFASWLATEANEANAVKRDTPVMVVLGNPPYSGESQNKGEWIMKLMEDYKKEPGGKEKLKERNPKWINDDYVKFLRFGQYFIEKNGSGIVAFINPHGFLDNPTFRGMRWNLLKTYDKIYTIDLHGNSKKKETALDGSSDINVFDIQQGVSINLFIKTGKKKENELGKVFHYDLFGKREMKYDFLWKNSISTVHYSEINNSPPMYFMCQKNFALEKQYNNGFSVEESFNVKQVGIVTSRDEFVIDTDQRVLVTRIKDFFLKSPIELKTKYMLRENKSWQISSVQKKANEFNEKYIYKVSYRPFDERFIYYNNDFIERSRFEVMKHFLNNKNIGLVYSRQSTDASWSHIQISSCIVDNRYHFSYKGIPQEAPLYLYPEADGQHTIENERPARTPNLNLEIVKEIEAKLGLAFVPEPVDSALGSVTSTVTERSRSDRKTFAPIDLLDYIYAVLHCPSYREKYKEFLKIDFPRVPYPADKRVFWQLVKLGGELRQIHLLESPVVEKFITKFPVDGNNEITRLLFESPESSVPVGDAHVQSPTEKTNGRLWINDAQYFDDIPVIAWEFYIGGYQPAQKWLKDRKGRKLDFNDISHYQKIIVALTETDRIMKEIDQL
jgi:predicted helicase